MLAWLLHLHGVWIGPGKVTQAPETNPQVATENTEIKEYLKTVSGSPPDFRKRIEEMTPDGPWLVKSAQNLLKWQAWAEHFPDALWLLPVRPTAAIVASKMRHPGMSSRGVHANRAATKRHQALQRQIIGEVRHSHLVAADALCGGGPDGEEEARRAVEFCGLDFDARVYRGWVQPERWHT